eukprot:4775520-Amphidinium_carterae.1
MDAGRSELMKALWLEGSVVLRMFEIQALFHACLVLSGRTCFSAFCSSEEFSEGLRCTPALGGYAEVAPHALRDFQGRERFELLREIT